MRSLPPLLYVIVLNWNNPEDTIQCLQHLARCSYSHYRTLVIDNGSTDDSVARIRTAFPHTPVLRTGFNLGYAEGNNQGILHSLAYNPEYILLLNNDVFVEPDALGYLAAAADADAKIAAAGCKVPFYSDPQRLWAAGEPFPFGYYPLNTDRYNTPRDIRYAVGCCILLRRTALEHIGLLDPSFFCYFEEFDWCLRATQAGYRIVYVPEAVVYHRVAASLGNASSAYMYLQTRNYLYMSARHGRLRSGWWRFHDVFLVWLRDVVRIIVHLESHRLVRIWAATRGIIDFMRGRMGPPPGSHYRQTHQTGYGRSAPRHPHEQDTT